MKPLDKRNLQTQKLIDGLYSLSRSKKKDVYAVIAKAVESSRRKKQGVNFLKLQTLKYVVDGDIVIIPDKVLAVGNLEKKIKIYALSFSKSAKAKYKDLKPLTDLLKDNVDYKKLKIIK